MTHFWQHSHLEWVTLDTSCPRKENCVARPTTMGPKYFWVNIWIVFAYMYLHRQSLCQVLFISILGHSKSLWVIYWHNHNCSTWCVKVLLHERCGQTVCARQGLANGKNRNNSIKRYLITGHPYHSFLPPFSSILWRKETMNPPLFSFSLCTCSVKTVWLCSTLYMLNRKDSCTLELIWEWSETVILSNIIKEI